MNFEEVVKLIDALVFAKKGKHLSDLQNILLQAAWSMSFLPYDQIAKESGYSAKYLKQDVGPKLWQILSEIFGEKIRKSNFRSAIERQSCLLSQESLPTHILPACEGRELELVRGFDVSIQCSAVTKRNDDREIIDDSQVCNFHQFQDWGEAPDVSIFCDRKDELAKLEQWIMTEGCRLVAIVGMGGIGKTYLSVRLAEQIQEQFDYVIWRSLQRRCTGRKVAPSSLVIRGSVKLACAIATKLHSFTASDLGRSRK